MKRFIVGSTWDRTNRNGINNNFDYLFDGVATMNNLNIKADATLLKADAVLLNAENINNNNVDVQNQLDNIILESGTSDAEVVQSRTDSNGNTFPLLKDRLNNIDKSILSRGVNLMDFGAKGDGVSDDTEYFKQFISDENKNKYIPQGEFLITEPIEILQDNINLISDGFLTSDKNNITLIDIQGDNNKIQINIDGKNILPRGVKCEGYNNTLYNSEIKDLYSESKNAYAFSVVPKGITKVCGNKINNINAVGDSATGNFIGASRAILLSRSEEIDPNDLTVVEGNYIKDVLGEEGDAIHLLYSNYGDSNCVIKENTVINASRRFIKLQCSKAKVERNTFEENTDVVYAHPSQAIDIQYGSDIEILDNHVSTKQLGSIYINGTDADNLSQNIVISRNTIEINGTNYMYCNFAKNVVVEGNSFKNGRLFAFDRSSHFKISNNSITSQDNTSSPLFRLSSTTSNFVIERNILKAGVYLWFLENRSPFLVFKDNTALSNTPGFRTFDTAIQSIHVYNVIGGKTIQYGDTTQQLFENNYSKDDTGNWI